VKFNSYLDRSLKEMDNVVENGIAMQELVWKVDSFDKIL
jgi:hypothetical protein